MRSKILNIENNKTRLLCLGVAVLMISCFPVETKNAKKAYEYWSGEKPPVDIEIINGAYYQSPHFTLEYEFFLKFKPTIEWREAFLDYNELEIDTLNEETIRFIKSPKWFLPNYKFKTYSKNEAFDRSRYFVNQESGVCYIYETVGM